MMRRYDVIDYWDIWYNEDSMPTVNNASRVGTVTWDIDKMTEHDIVKNMIDLGWLLQDAIGKVEVLWGDDMFFEIETNEGTPLYGLRVSEDQANLPPSLPQSPQTT